MLKSDAIQGNAVLTSLKTAEANLYLIIKAKGLLVGPSVFAPVFG
jgi:hypothetical protein